MAQSVTVRWSGRAVGQRVRAAAARGVLLWAEYVLTESNARVPLDEATLERSGVASSDPGKLKAAVSYDTPYAVRQHEDLLLRHAPGRHAKYLETALNESGVVGPQLVAKEIRRATA